MTTTTEHRRRRARVAQATRRRIERQQAQTATRYGQARTAAQRLDIRAAALRSAGTPGSHQRDQAAADTALERCAEQMRALRHRITTDPRQRLAAEAAALRAAAAAAGTAEEDRARQALEQAAATAAEETDRLHAAQRRAADRVLTREQTRQRKETR